MHWGGRIELPVHYEPYYYSAWVIGGSATWHCTISKLPGIHLPSAFRGARNFGSSMYSIGLPIYSLAPAAGSLSSGSLVGPYHLAMPSPRTPPKMGTPRKPRDILNLHGPQTSGAIGGVPDGRGTPVRPCVQPYDPKMVGARPSWAASSLRDHFCSPLGLTSMAQGCASGMCIIIEPQHLAYTLMVERMPTSLHFVPSSMGR
mmetsp:Transcript_35331/g.92739  ORF Transcript_35331/g.92739 Transcript_35331/m.92739 type:complete len:202 (+) Transcript_35331:82-687(+)